ncbi:CAP domain-containing protein [Nocardioides limicola]|uniref:CAP domain-containing protein n=1 Tax=Nocardioides limicola TaxID=2803368 RepID=UPI00193B66E1|nr:CAP domain-containing protein [Nocardioides sp. DJM-14]
MRSRTRISLPASATIIGTLLLSLVAFPAQATATTTSWAKVGIAAPDLTTVEVDARALWQLKRQRRVMRLTNLRRAAHGCPALRNRAELNLSARRHNLRMARAGTLSHQLPGEPRLGVRVTQAGYLGWTRVGENVARGYPKPRAVVRAWMRSPGHRAIILDCSYRHIGVAVDVGNGTYWWTQNFGRK